MFRLQWIGPTFCVRNLAVKLLSLFVQTRWEVCSTWDVETDLSLTLCPCAGLETNPLPHWAFLIWRTPCPLNSRWWHEGMTGIAPCKSFCIVKPVKWNAKCNPSSVNGGKEGKTDGVSPSETPVALLQQVDSGQCSAVPYFARLMWCWRNCWCCRFSLIKEHLVEFNQLAMTTADGSHDMLNRVMTKDNIGLAALFETKGMIWENGEISPGPSHLHVAFWTRQSQGQNCCHDAALNFSRLSKPDSQR